MKSICNILKVIALLLFLVVCVIGYKFTSVWQSDVTCEVTESTWKEDTVKFGEEATLTLRLQLPWHREFSSAVPLGLPEGFIVMRNKESLIKRSLNWRGYRTWDIQCSMVPLKNELAENSEIKFPLALKNRMKNNMVAVKLPKLNIEDLTDIPETPINKFTNLDPALAVANETLDHTPPVADKPNYYLILAIILSVIVIAYLIFLKLSRKTPEIPVWETALKHLSELQSSKPDSNEAFHITLTDIIKTYTGKRYSFKANSESSTEYIESLKTIESLDSKHKDSLTSIIRDADLVKFAAGSTNDELRDSSIDNARNFIESTVPQQLTNNHA